MKLSDIHRQFLTEAEQPMFVTQRPPIAAKEDDTGPIIPMSRWVISEETGYLTKTYRFLQLSDKVKFVMGIMEHELETQHSPDVITTENEVTVSYITKDVNRVTELDKECARFCDLLFKDIVR